MSGKFFDDWVEGEEYITPSRTLTETDVVMFAAMTGDYNELHTSEEFMKNSQFGKRPPFLNSCLKSWNELHYMVL